MKNTNKKGCVLIILILIISTILSIWVFVQNSNIAKQCNENYDNHILLKDIQNDNLRRSCMEIYSYKKSQEEKSEKVDEYVEKKKNCEDFFNQNIPLSKIERDDLDCKTYYKEQLISQ